MTKTNECRAFETTPACPKEFRMLAGKISMVISNRKRFRFSLKTRFYRVVLLSLERIRDNEVMEISPIQAIKCFL